MTTIEFDSQLLSLYPTLRPAALKLTRDNEEANDLLQETVLKAFSNKDKFRAGTNLKAWLYTIMKNTFITNYHRLVRRKTFIDTTDNLHYINSSENTIQNRGYGKLKSDEVESAVDSLSYEYKTPFMMYFTGYKYHEISDILEIPIGTVKNRIHIARKELKQKLRAYSPTAA